MIFRRRESLPSGVWPHVGTGTDLAETRRPYRCRRCAVPKLDSSLALGRATYERWLGTEPDRSPPPPRRSAASSRSTPRSCTWRCGSAALYRSRRCSQRFCIQSWRRRMTRSGGGYSRASPPPPAPSGPRRSFVQVSSGPWVRPRASFQPSYPFVSAQVRAPSPTPTEPWNSSARPSGSRMAATISPDTAPE